MIAASQILIYLFGSVVSFLLIALIAQFLTKIIAGFRPLFWRVFFALLVPYITIHTIGSFLIETGSLVPQGGGLLGILLLIVVGFVLQAFLMVLWIRGRQGQTISFGQAILVSVLQLVIWLMILAAIGILFAALIA